MTKRKERKHDCGTFIRIALLSNWGSPNGKEKKDEKHTVDILLNASDIAKAGAAVRFKIHDRDGLLRMVEIGQGSFMSKGAKRQSFKRIPWTQFAGYLDAY
jgi:hypothetical protein